MDPELDENTLDTLTGIYSDVYKELHGIRPRWERFDSVDQVELAILNLYDEIDHKAEIEAHEREEREYDQSVDREVEDLQPGIYDREHLPKYSGMGRRAEELQENLKLRIRRIIREVVSR